MSPDKQGQQAKRLLLLLLSLLLAFSLGLHSEAFQGSGLLDDFDGFGPLLLLTFPFSLMSLRVQCSGGPPCQGPAGNLGLPSFPLGNLGS